MRRILAPSLAFLIVLLCNATPPAASAVEPTLDDIWENVFSPKCSECHGSGGFLGFKADTKQNAFDTLVNQPAAFCPGEIRVVPNDADASYLIKKLEGTMDCGDQMPLGDPPLDGDTIAAIRAWINAGALFEEPTPVASATWSAIKALY